MTEVSPSETQKRDLARGGNVNPCMLVFTPVVPYLGAKTPNVVFIYQRRNKRSREDLDGIIRFNRLYRTTFLASRIKSASFVDRN